MRKLLLTIVCFGFYFFATAQNAPKVGDELVIKTPTNQTYNYIKFPKPNILKKRGVVTSYKSVSNETVIIDDVVTKNNGTTYVVLKKKDGTKFFGYLNKVKANYAKALEAKEIEVVK